MKNENASVVGQPSRLSLTQKMLVRLCGIVETGATPVLLGLLVLAFSVSAFAKDAAPKIAKPKIEVCFVLDTTGSMGGLIEGAKQKIWSIANDIATAKPARDIRFALVPYRDRGDEYVVKTFDLTNDLESPPSLRRWTPSSPS